MSTTQAHPIAAPDDDGLAPAVFTHRTGTQSTELGPDAGPNASAHAGPDAGPERREISSPTSTENSVAAAVLLEARTEGGPDGHPGCQTEALPEILPAHRFYWALFPAPAGMPLRAHGALPLDRAPAALAELAQDQIPVPLATLHGVLVHVGGSRERPLALACALRVTELDHAGLLCRPDSLPEFVRSQLATAERETQTTDHRTFDLTAPDLRTLDLRTLDLRTLDLSTLDLSTLNVLIGAFEPQPLRIQRRRRIAISLASLIVVLVAGVVGVERRTAALRAHSAAARGELARIADSAAPLPPSTDPAMDTLGPMPRLESALQTQRLTHRDVSTRNTAHEPVATDVLAALLAVWPHVPDDTDLRTGMISATPASLVIAVDLAGDPRPFLGAVRAPAGWRLVEPSIASAGDRTQVTLQFRPVPVPERGAP